MAVGMMAADSQAKAPTTTVVENNPYGYYPPPAPPPGYQPYYNGSQVTYAPPATTYNYNY
jgi:hypothetical protein